MKREFCCVICLELLTELSEHTDKTFLAHCPNEFCDGGWNLGILTYIHSKKDSHKYTLPAFQDDGHVACKLLGIQWPT